MEPSGSGREECEDLDTIHACIERIIALTAGSIEELATETGVSYATLYGWATDRRTPTTEHLLSLAEIADRRADALRETAALLREIGRREAEHPGPLPGTEEASSDDG